MILNQESMGVVEQDNEKQMEQFDSLEDLYVEGTRELWQFLSFEQSRASCPVSTGQCLCPCDP